MSSKGTIFVNPKTNEEKFFLFTEKIPDGFVPKDTVVIQDEFGPRTVSPEAFAGTQEGQPIDTDSLQQQGLETADFTDVNALIHQQEIDEQFTGVLGQARGFFTGLGSKASLGLLDPAIAGAIGKDELAAAHRSTGGVVGGLVGSIAPALVTGGGSLVGLVRATPAGLLARGATSIGARVAPGLGRAAVIAGVEGAGFGIGQGVSNLTLSNKPFTAEAMVSELGLNALYGAALGGAGGVAGTLLSRAGQKIANFGPKLGSTADNVVFTESVESVGKLANHQAQGLKKLQGELLEDFEVALKGVDPGNIKSTAVLAEEFLQKLDPDLVPARLSKKVQDLKGTVAGKRGAKAQKELLEEVSKISKEVPISEEVSASITNALKKTDIRLDPKIHELVKKVETSGKNFEDIFDSPKAFQKFLDDDLDKAFATLKQMDDHYKNVGQLAKAMGKTTEGLDNVTVSLNDAVNKLVGQTDEGVDLQSLVTLLGAGELVIPEFEGPFDDIAKFLLAYKLSSRSGLLANPKLAEAAKKSGFARAVGDAANVAGRQAGFRAGRDKNVLIQGGLAVAGGKLFRKVADSVVDGTAKLHHATGKAASRIATAMGKTLSGAGKGVRRLAPTSAAVILRDFNLGQDTKNETPKESIQRLTTQLDSMVVNPGSAQEIHEALGPVRKVNMQVGDHLAGHAKRVAEFLQSKLPRDPGILQRFGKSIWRPREEDIQRYARYVRAAQDPAGIIERFADRTITREDWETLETLYPEHHKKLHEWMGDNLEEIQTKWDYSYRTQISRLSNNPVEPTARFNWQDTFAVSAATPPPAQEPSTNQPQPTQAQSLASGER